MWIRMLVLSFSAMSILGCASSVAEEASAGSPRAKDEGYGYQYEVDPVTAKTPPLSAKQPFMVQGRIIPEHIQDVVRTSFPAMRACYATAVAKDPSVKGIVSTRFVIEPDGKVSSAKNESSTLADAATSRCVADAFRTLEFTAPETAMVTVVYPLDFSH